jgi:hypothetical protein
MKLIRHYPWTYSVLVIGVLVTVLIALLAGCSSGSENSGNTHTSAPAWRDATEVAQRLVEQGMPVTDIATTTEDNDPNDLLGRQGGYVSRATFALPGVEGGDDEQDARRGGSVEVWPTEEAAIARWEYLRGFQSSPLLGDGYDYVFGPTVLRLAREVKPSVAERFEVALRPAVAIPSGR